MLKRLGDHLAAKIPLIDTLVRWNLRRVDKLKARKRERESASFKYKTAVLAIMKNEALNIEEWVEHYLWQGVDRIYLIDNGSTDDTVSRVQPWVDAGQVEVIELTGKWMQAKHYWSAIEHFKVRENCEWLIVADLDEFWFCKDGTPIPQALDTLTYADVIYAHWSLFGSSGHDNHPHSLRECLTKRVPGLDHDYHTKWIVRTKALTGPNAIHVHKIKEACSSRTFMKDDVFQLNHYQTQSRQFWTTVKMQRGDADNAQTEHIRQLTTFKELDEKCTETDERLKNLWLNRVL